MTEGISTRPHPADPAAAGSNGSGRAGGQPPTSGPAAGGVPRQRRREMVALGVALVCLGALAAGGLYVSVGQRSPAVVVTQNVPVGTTINPGEVGTAMVSAGEGVRTISGGELRSVVGQRAATDLRAGTLLAPSQVTRELAPGPGRQLVPVALAPGQLPAGGLSPGDKVLVVPTPAAAGRAAAARGGKAVLSEPVPATVHRVGRPNRAGTVVVDLLVAADRGPAVAKQASTGRLALVVTPRGQ